MLERRLLLDMLEKTDYLVNWGNLTLLKKSERCVPSCFKEFCKASILKTLTLPTTQNSNKGFPLVL